MGSSRCEELPFGGMKMTSVIIINGLEEKASDNFDDSVRPQLSGNVEIDSVQGWTRGLEALRAKRYRVVIVEPCEATGDMEVNNGESKNRAGG